MKMFLEQLLISLLILKKLALFQFYQTFDLLPLQTLFILEGDKIYKCSYVWLYVQLDP